jgi:trk system potassium uptake protein
MKITAFRLNRTTSLVLHDVGLLFHVPGVMALASLPICLGFGEFYAVLPFLMTAIASFIPAQLLVRLCPADVNSTHSGHAMMIAALSWAGIALVGAIPFWGIATVQNEIPQFSPTVAAFQNGWNAVFESFSGFTGTGLSVAQNVSELPHSLQWWRSLSQWIDGVGVIVLVLAVLEPGVDASELYAAEGRQKMIAETMMGTAKKTLGIYGFYTGVSILLLMLVGMPGWEAINHGMTGISTGGFSVRDDNIAGYNPLAQLAIVLIMTIGAISFPIHYRLIRQRRGSLLWQDPQTRALLLLLGSGALVLLLGSRWFSGSFLWIHSLFQWVSALTTCGFNTANVESWSASAKLLLSVGMIIGGCSGSSVGGLKLSRIITLYKGICWQFQRLLLADEAAVNYRLDGEDLTEPQANQQVGSAAVLTVLWLWLLGVSVFILAHLVSPEYTLEDVLFEAVSATSNAGLSTGMSNPNLLWSGKLILILLMWVGRLEIIPVLLLGISLVRVLGRAFHPR